MVFIVGASTCFPQHGLHPSQQLQVPSGTPALRASTLSPGNFKSFRMFSVTS